MRYMLIPVAGKQIYNRNLDHCVASGFLAHRCSGGTNKYLTCKSRIIYLHIELNELILGQA